MGNEEQDNLAVRLTGHIADLAKRVADSVILMKLFIIGAGAVGAVMQFAPSGGAQLSSPQIIGGSAAALVALFGIFVLVAEKDASAMLRDANLALTAAQQSKTTLQEYELEIIDYNDQLGKSVELYVAMGNARNFYERALTAGSVEMDKLLQELLTTSKRQFAAAMDIATADRWTLCIYKAYRNEAGSRELKLIAHIRAIECDLSDARIWPEGVGFSGIALSTGHEIIVGDMTDAAISQIYNVKQGLVRHHDATLYQSAIACPIYVGEDDEPWGVATATNDKPDHFVDEERGGVQNAEAVRAVANMAATIVALCRADSSRQGA